MTKIEIYRCYSLFIVTPTIRSLTYTTQESLVTSLNELMTTTIFVTNESLCYYPSFPLLFMIYFLITVSIIDMDSLINEILFIFSM
jgi:hypothetical protein